MDAKKFYKILDVANQPIYENCRKFLSKFSLAAKMMNVKTDRNLSEFYMNAWAELFKKYVPKDKFSDDS